MVDNTKASFLVCPKCGATFEKAKHLCPRCHYYSPEQWMSSKKTGSRPKWKRRLIILCVLFLFLGFLGWQSRPFIPNPTILLRKPVSKINAVSGPGEWTVYAYDPGHTQYLPTGSPLKGRIRWALDLGEPTSSSPAVKDGTVYIGGHFKVHALEADTGESIWEAETSGPVHSSPAIAGNQLFLGLLDGGLIALDRRTGKLNWKYGTQNYVFSSPVVTNGILYTGSGDRAIYALDVVTGKLIWKTRTGGLILFTPAVKDNILYALSGDRILYSLSAATGALRLRYRVYRSFLGSPVVANNLVYFVANDGRLYTIRHKTREYPGQYKILLTWLQFWWWRLPVPLPPRQTGSMWRVSPKNVKQGFISSPAVTPDALYIGDRLGRLYARDAKEGKALWEFQSNSSIEVSPLVVGDRVYSGSRAGHLYALDRGSGEVIWKIFLGAPIKISPVYASGLIFIKTGDGRLHAIE